MYNTWLLLNPPDSEGPDGLGWIAPASFSKNLERRCDDAAKLKPAPRENFDAKDVEISRRADSVQPLERCKSRVVYYKSRLASLKLGRLVTRHSQRQQQQEARRQRRATRNNTQHHRTADCTVRCDVLTFTVWSHSDHLVKKHD